VFYLPSDALVAIDKLTGKQLWKTPGPTASPASPAHQILDDIPQIVLPVGNGPSAEIWGVHAKTGEVFWKSPVRIGYGLCSSPVADGTRVLVSSGAPGQEFFTALQMFVQDGKIRALPAWTRKDTQTNFANTVAVVDGAVFGFGNRSLDCTGAADGKIKWRAEGTWSHDQQLIVADRLIFAVSGPDLVLAAADPEAYRELGRFRLPIKASQQQPTLANGRLYIRGEKEIIAYDVKAP
jgi:outer membrane protein assembly factor BamB